MEAQRIMGDAAVAAERLMRGAEVDAERMVGQARVIEARAAAREEGRREGREEGRRELAEMAKKAEDLRDIIMWIYQLLRNVEH